MYPFGANARKYRDYSGDRGNGKYTGISGRSVADETIGEIGPEMGIPRLVGGTGIMVSYETVGAG
jgi:hypothetical protein